MSKRQTKGKLRPGDPGYVGRGHPPKSGQIKPGEVRNPNGRAGKAPSQEGEADFKAQMRRLLKQPIQSKDGQTFSRLEHMMNSLTKQVNNGDVSAIKLLYELFKNHMYDTAEEAALAALEDKEKLIEDALVRVAEKRAADQQSAQPQDDDDSYGDPAEDVGGRT